MRKQLLTVDPEALLRIKELMKSRDNYPLGLRVSLRTKGCSGLSWNLEFIDEINSYDEKIIIDEDLIVYIDPKAVMFVIGTEISFLQTELEEGFIFTNPNEKGKCGCGESFTV